MDTLDRVRPTPSIAQAYPPLRHRQGRWRALILALAAGAIFAAVSGFLVEDHIAEDQRFDQVQASVVLTRHHASDEASQLAGLRRAVATLRSQVNIDSATWSRDTAELEAAYAVLVLTRASVSQQTSHITALDTCLSGVRQALNALAISDHAGADSALDSVAGSCAAASGS